MNSTSAASDLEKIIIKEAFWVLGLHRFPRLGRILSPVVRLPIRRFAAFLADFEQDTVSSGLQAAAGIHLDNYVEQVNIINSVAIPDSGPLIVAANHPGTYDLLMLMSAIPRDDLKVISSNVAMVRALPATASHFIFMSTESVVGDPHSRMGALRQSIRHLQRGGSLLVFASGRVDPDPALRPVEARQELGNWSGSLSIMLRRVPETQIVNAIVSGVLSKNWYHSPVTWLRKEAHYKQKVAEVFQIMQQFVFGRKSTLNPRLVFGTPKHLADLQDKANEQTVIERIIFEAKYLMSEGITTDEVTDEFRA